MNHIIIALIVFACVFGSALLGLYVRSMLPEHHLSDESIGVVKLATGLIATMAALVLGLLISSAKSSFDTVNGELVHSAASIIRLDRVLAQYGPETQDVRLSVKEAYGHLIQVIASGDAAQLASLTSREAIAHSEALQRKLQALTPAQEEQRQLKARAGQIADEVLAVRWLALLQSVGSIPVPLLVTLVLWLSIIFGTFGMFAGPNGTVIAALALGALSVSGAIFLVMEMTTPLGGVITVSLEPLRDAYAILGQ
ncbi:hypothetical protein [Paraburkholderia sp. GAS334]|uniref:bestrophin-like domain n=1 Tax=Paraburkholderia sp. GAS334 TaxID=3035131 RepID=UPI003D23C8D9